MHVHVGIGDDELRVALMNQFARYLPLVLALSTSSPFWQGINTGLKSYRLTVFDGFPRTGLPERFENFSDYQRTIETLRRAGIIADATFIWWDMRISARYPTLECRIADICTRIDDAASIAALIQSILHYLYRLQREGQRGQDFPRFLIDQNRWYGMRYGCSGGLVDFATDRIVPVEELLADTVEMVHRDAAELGCLAELENTLQIPHRGTSADRQIRCYEEAIKQGRSPDAALHEVVDMLIAETVRDT
jgi:carboxylate-amine ligase